MNNNEHLERMRDIGKKGGLSRGKKYNKNIAKAVNLYLNHPELNQQEIAKECGVSQAFVSIHTRGLKPLRKGKRMPTEEVLTVIEILRNKEAINNAILSKIVLNEQEELDADYKL